MAYINGVETTVYPRALMAVASGPELHRYLEQIAAELMVTVRAAAPKRTGAGARSIEAETVLTPEGWVAVVSWDSKHWYLSIQETHHPFAAPALEAVRFV